MSLRATLGSKSLYPSLQYPIYLAHSAIAPISIPVQQRLQETIQKYAEKGMGCVMEFVEQRESLRAKIATLIHAQPEEIALSKNTSEGIIAIAQSLDWKPNDRIILYEGEFPSNITPWLQAAQEQQLQTKFLSQPRSVEQVLEQTEGALKQGARLLALSAVQFQTGFRMPLEEIGMLCQQYNCLFFVDAIQACGATPINVQAQNIDFLSSGGHKWLMGVEGTAFIYIRNEHIPRIKPRLFSWLSHQNGLSFLFEGAGLLRYDRPFKNNASVLEGGVSNALGCAGLESAIDILLSLGVENIHQHIQQYIIPLEEEVIALGFQSLRTVGAESSILSLVPPKGKQSTDIIPHYAQRGICITGPDGLLRIAPHWCNNNAEQEQFIQATKEILSL